MVGNNGSPFNYIFRLDGQSALMTDRSSEDSDYYEGEEADAVRTTFVAPVLAILNHSNYFYADEQGFRCDNKITYGCEILGAGPATITASNILVTLENGTLYSITCDMHQVCKEGVLDVSVTFTFTDYGTTVVEAPAAE